MLTLSIPEDVSAIAIRIDSFHVDMHEKASECFRARVVADTYKMLRTVFAVIAERMRTNADSAEI
jgi:hypothetical protein